MANRYWVGGNSTWDATAGTKWALASGGAGGQTVPTAADAVFLDNGTGTGNVTISATSVCLSLNCTGYVGTLTFNAQLTVSGAVTFASGMTIAGTVGPLILTTAATHTSAGKTLTCPLTMQGAVTHTLADDWTVSALVTLGGTTLTTTINGQTLNCGAGLTVGGSTAIVTGTTAVKLTGTGTWQGPTSTGALRNNLTINAAAGTVTLSGTVRYNTGTLTYTNGTLAGASTPVLSIAVATTLTGFSGSTAATGQMPWGVSITAAITVTLGSNLNVNGDFGTTATGTTTFSGAFSITCATLSCSGTATTWALSGSITCTGLWSNSCATSFTWTGAFDITAGSCTISNTQTITLPRSLTISGLTTSADANVINGAFNWNTAGLTTTGNVSGTATIVFNGTGTWTGPGTLSNTCTINTAGTLTISGVTSPAYTTGVLTYVAGTVSAGASSTLDIMGSCTLDTNGVTWGTVSVNAAATITLPSTLRAQQLSLTNANVTFAGTAGWILTGTGILGILYLGSTLTATRTVTLAAGVTYVIGGQFTTNQDLTPTVRWAFTSSSGSVRAILTLGPGATQDLGYVDATRIDSSQGQTIYSFRGSITDSPNWTTTIPSVVREPFCQLGA